MRAISALAVIIGGLTLAACAPGGLDRDAMIADTSASYDVSVGVATCMVDELIGAFGEDQLAQSRKPHPAEIDVLEGAQDRCTVREATITEIMRTAGDHEIAACIFDRAADAFGFDAVTSGRSTPDDEDALAAIARACGNEAG